jgi:Ca2+-transporting ATPase
MGQTFDDLFESAMWNSSARIEHSEGQWVTKGNVTEQGIIKFFMNVKGAEGCISKKNDLAEEDQLQLISFSSSRKRASIVVKRGDGVRVYTKGAPDMLFQYLTGVLNSDGQVHGLNDSASIPEELRDVEGDDTQLGLLQRTVKFFATEAFRTILMCYRDLSMREYE